MKPLASFLLAALLLVMGAAACTGSTGPAGPSGPTGGGYYTSRADVYCNTNAYSLGDTAATITASCSTALDLPLTGACDLSGAAYGAVPYLTTNRLQYWAGTGLTQPAEWICGWQDSTRAAFIAPGATVTICCITVPPP